MNHLRELYQEMIIEHNKNPRHFEFLPTCTHESHGDNPLCGDTYDIRLTLDDGLIKEIAFQGHGCAISKASASLMTVHVQGKSIEEAEVLIQTFRQMLTQQASPEELKSLGHLRVFQGVSQLPERIKCAVLPWHTLSAALNGHAFAQP